MYVWKKKGSIFMSRLMIRGGYGEHGRSCFLVEYGTEGRLYMVDCGILDTDPFPYPDVQPEELERVDYLFLTHCHKDHSGAFEYFVERGFQGTLVTSGTTYRLAKIAYERTEFLEMHDDYVRQFGPLHLRYGRSGHCPGGLWFEITENGSADDDGKAHTIFFSGDYQEDTLVYRCDPIRSSKAELAIIDCAHRETELDAKALREQINKMVSEKLGQKRSVILPVPQYGRGLELWILMKQTFPEARVCVDRDFVKYAEEMLKESVWYYGDAFENLNAGEWDMLEVERLLSVGQKEEYDILILADTHLKKQHNLDFVNQEIASGTAVLINGRVKKNGPVGKLLAAGKVERFLFPHHQSNGDFKRIIKQNQFGMVLPFHNDEREVYY